MTEQPDAPADITVMARMFDAASAQELRTLCLATTPS